MMNKQTMKTMNALSFGTSVFFLTAATAYGIIRRCSGMEFPGFVTGWLAPVFLAAAVGYLTNWLAIQLLFRPNRPVRWLGGIQGMIPKKQSELAEMLAREIPANLMPADQIVFQIRRKIREAMQDPELAGRLQTMVAEHIRDERRRKGLVKRIEAILEVAGSTGFEAGLTPSHVRRFYHAYGAGFVREKVVRNKALRKKILNELKDQIPGLVCEIRTTMPAMLAEYMRNNPIRGTVLSIFTGANGENLPWRKLERSIRDKLSGQEADQQVKQKLAEFGARLDGYLVSPELEADITALKQNSEIGDTLAAMRADLAGKLLEFLEEEIVWRIVREQMLPAIRVFLLLQIRRNKDAIIAGLDLPGHIRKSILSLKPESIHELVARVSGEELGLIQLLGFVLGGFAGFLIVFTQ